MLHEELLLPVLNLMAAAGQLTVSAATRLLSSQRAAQAGSYPVLTTPDTLYQAVASAIHSLNVAGLLESKGDSSWVITQSGRDLVKAKPPSVDFDYLKRFPSYQQYWEDVARDNRRQDFLALRFEYYACGRLLVLQGSFDAASVLLAYSIEFHLKAALVEVEEEWSDADRRMVGTSHNLRELYQAALRKGLLKGSFISTDFLDFAHDHFERRYPTGARALGSRKGYYSFGRRKLHTYDDATIQLDSALADLYDSASYSLGVHAFKGLGVSSAIASAFFQGNVFALEKLAKQKALLDDEPHLNLNRELLVRPEALFAQEGFAHPGESLQTAKELLEWNLAAFYRYPAKDEPDPDPARMLSHQRDTRRPFIHYSRWVVEAATREFGEGAVELAEDQNMRQVVLHVFDRRAKKWYRSLVLRKGNVERFIGNAQNKGEVDKWLQETRNQFKRRRAGLRTPPRRKK